MDVTRDIFCPGCGTRIEVQPGTSNSRLRLAVSLQALGFGTEVWCRRCGAGHVLSRTSATAPPDLPEIARNGVNSPEPAAQPGDAPAHDRQTSVDGRAVSSTN